MMNISNDMLADFSRVSYDIKHPDNYLHKSRSLYDKVLKEVIKCVGDSFGIDDAEVLCYMGFFVTHKNFGDYESMHEYDGMLYYEDGACVTTSGLLEHPYDWMHDGWYIKYTPDKVNFSKLKDLHTNSKGRMLNGTTYEECIVK